MALKETALKQIKYLLLCDKMVIFRPACRCASLIFYAFNRQRMLFTSHFAFRFH